MFSHMECFSELFFEIFKALSWLIPYLQYSISSLHSSHRNGSLKETNSMCCDRWVLPHFPSTQHQAQRLGIFPQFFLNLIHSFFTICTFKQTHKCKQRAKCIWESPTYSCCYKLDEEWKRCLMEWETMWKVAFPVLVLMSVRHKNLEAQSILLTVHNGKFYVNIKSKMQSDWPFWICLFILWIYGRCVLNTLYKNIYIHSYFTPLLITWWKI